MVPFCSFTSFLLLGAEILCKRGFPSKREKRKKSSGRMRGSSGSGGSAADIGRNADWLGKQAKVVPGTDQWAVETHGGGV